MRFRLFYRGPLRSNGSPFDKHNIRLALHGQLADLASKVPLSTWARCFGPTPVDHWPHAFRTADNQNFIPVIFSGLKLIARLDILFLRPEEPGHVITQGGDLDNRLKTLFDALRVPKPGELPQGAAAPAGQNACWCLLEDDALIVELSVQTDRLLEPQSQAEVLLIISVTVGASEHVINNAGLASF